MAESKRVERSLSRASDTGFFQLLDAEGVLHGKTSLPEKDWVSIYRHMRFIRIVDERMLTLQRQGRISFYGAATGQEGAVIGSGYALQSNDWVFPALREGGVALLRGYDFNQYIAQLFGNSADETLGRQMPCHYSDARTNFVSLSSPIGNQIPQAVGVAWAAKIQGNPDVAIGYMGDGATSEGDFHVALNMAGLHKLPVVFFCQNNQWAISLPSNKQTASETIAIKSRAYGMPGIRVDGNDVFACYEATLAAVERARAGEGPTLIEALTYRLGAHSTSDDPSKYRDESITEEWKSRCPLERMLKLLISRGLWTLDEENAFFEDTVIQIKKVIAEQEVIAPPAPETLFTDVYAEVPWHLKEQEEELRQAILRGETP
jgi:pyruvate dehydrogenase E1 component alpha subunit